MRICYFFAAFLFILLSAPNSNAQVEARLHQVFEVKDARKIKIKIDETKHEVNIKETYSTVIVVEIIVMLNHVTPNEMEGIIRQGRYAVQAIAKDGTILLEAKDDKTPLLINGKTADEHIIYNIAVPEYLEY